LESEEFAHEEGEAMTDVNMDEPLPAIPIDMPGAPSTSGKVRVSPSLANWFGVIGHMTLSHLVQVLAALTVEQLGAVINGLNASRAKLAPSPTPATPWPETASSEMDILLLADLAKEKARADRAEFWCERLRQALLGVQDAMRGVFSTPQLDSILAEYEESKNG
jgi:hypothetical protein